MSIPANKDGTINVCPLHDFEIAIVDGDIVLLRIQFEVRDDEKKLRRMLPVNLTLSPQMATGLARGLEKTVRQIAKPRPKGSRH